MQTARTSNKASDGAVQTGPGMLAGAHLAAGADAATLILYDNTAGSGTILLKLSAPANGNDDAQFPFPIPFSTGLYAVLAGTGPNATVNFF